MAKLEVKNGITSVITRVKILDSSSTTGEGLSGLTSGSSGLVISTIADNEATPISYAVDSAEVQDIPTLGTYIAPGTGKCRFEEVNAANHKGLYEIQLADARWNVTNAKSLIISVYGASNVSPIDAEYQLLGNTIEEIYTTTNTMSADINSLQSDMNAVSADVDTIHTNTNTISADITSLQSDINTISADINEMQIKLNAISADTNQVQGKLPSGNFFDTATTTISANLVKIAGSTTVDTVTLQTLFELILSILNGDVIRSGNVYTYKKQDGATTTTTHTITSGARSVS
jgi:methyl-accepting chemotaxis protein